MGTVRPSRYHGRATPIIPIQHSQWWGTLGAAVQPHLERIPYFKISALKCNFSGPQAAKVCHSQNPQGTKQNNIYKLCGLHVECLHYATRHLFAWQEACLPALVLAKMEKKSNGRIKFYKCILQATGEATKFVTCGREMNHCGIGNTDQSTMCPHLMPRRSWGVEAGPWAL